MNMPALEEPSRLETAQQRLADAMIKLESILANPSAPVADPTSEDSEKLIALHEEVAVLKRDNTMLENVNDAALGKIENTIARLKAVLVT